MLVDIKKDGVNYFGISENVAISKGLLVEYEQEKQAQLLKLAKDNRKYAYVLESDPLYMEWQYDKTAEKEQAWRDKVAEIKTRYPLPDEAA